MNRLLQASSNVTTCRERRLIFALKAMGAPGFRCCTVSIPAVVQQSRHVQNFRKILLHRVSGPDLWHLFNRLSEKNNPPNLVKTRILTCLQPRSNLISSLLMEAALQQKTGFSAGANLALVHKYQINFLIFRILTFSQPMTDRSRGEIIFCADKADKELPLLASG